MNSPFVCKPQMRQSLPRNRHTLFPTAPQCRFQLVLDLEALLPQVSPHHWNKQLKIESILCSLIGHFHTALCKSACMRTADHHHSGHLHLHGENSCDDCHNCSRSVCSLIQCTQPHPLLLEHFLGQTGQMEEQMHLEKNKWSLLYKLLTQAYITTHILHGVM